jgi:RNA polymerase sigma factor (sigma-70 family)
VRPALPRRQAEGLVKRCRGPQRARSEQALVLFAKRGGARQREDLIEALRPSIASVARRYRHAKGVSHAELMQEGIVGLLRGLERFDPQRGVPFWAYASWWVRQAMQQLVSELSRPMVLSDRALRELAHVKETRRTLEQDWGREPTRHELTRAADVPSAHLERLICADQAPRGLQEPVSDQTTGATTLGDLVDDPRAQEAFERVAQRLCADQIPRLLALLTERERLVIRSRYGIEARKQTLGEVAADVGVSAERIRQIEQAALQKLYVGVR